MSRPLRTLDVTPHVAQNKSPTKTGKLRRSAIDGRTIRPESYALSQRRRKMIECIFGWGKQHGTMRKAKHRGVIRVAAVFLLNLIAYNLIRIPKLVAAWKDEPRHGTEFPANRENGHWAEFALPKRI
jgi:Transposase DDE domain